MVFLCEPSRAAVSRTSAIERKLTARPSQIRVSKCIIDDSRLRRYLRRDPMLGDLVMESAAFG